MAQGPSKPRGRFGLFGNYKGMRPPNRCLIPNVEKYDIQPNYWPLTVEECFSAALRRNAEEEGAYALSATPQSNLIEEPAHTKRMFEIIGNLDDETDDRFYLMAPDHNCKLAYSEWITRPEQRTKENYAAFERILSGLVAIVNPVCPEG